MLFRKTAFTLLGASALALTPAVAGAQAANGGDAGTATPAPTPNPKVGGVEMLPTRTIVDNVSAAPTLSTLAELLKIAGQDTALSGPGPFTVFAPTNDAFDRLDAAALASLKTPARRELLTRVLTYHVVAGDYDAEKLLKLAQDGGGKATLTTVEGEPLTINLEKIQGNDALVLSDVGGNKAYFTQYNVKQSNGIVHTINGVLIPTQKTDAPAADDAASGAPAAGDDSSGDSAD